MSKVLVTGGTGFIGWYVVQTLLEDGHGVLVFDHNSPGTLRGTPQDRVEIFHGDVRDATSVTEAAAHVDGIIHLAAVLGTQETITNPRPSAETNILGSLNVFEAANQYDLPVVYAGVGNHWMRDHGAGSYTISKTAVEDFARMFNKFRKGKISVVRPVNAYGPFQSIAEPYGHSKVRKIMPSFICRALVGDDIELYGGGVQVSDCVYVGDVARTFVNALKYTRENGPETFGVGPTKSHTVREVADIVLNAAAPYAIGPRSKIVDLPMRPGEVPNSSVTADTSKLHLLGLDPDKDFVTLEAGISLTTQYYAYNWLDEYDKKAR